MRVHKPKRRRGRSDRRFRPGPWSDGRELESGLELETRVLLSARVVARTDAHHARATAARVTAARVLPPRPTPMAEIIYQYSQFANHFATIENYYIQSLSEQSGGTTTVTASVAAPYTAGSASIQVTSATAASAFFPIGPTAIPVTAQATFNGTFQGTFYLNSYQGSILNVNPTTSSQVDLSKGAILTASVTTSSQSSAASIFPSFITNRTNQMAIALVQYFNSLPLRLPYFNTPPHTPNSRGAIQKYVYNSVAGAASTSQSSTGTDAQGVEALPGLGATSLQQVLLAIPLPTATGVSEQIYDATVASAIQQSLTQTLNGVAQVYAGHIRVNAPIPNNRYGANESGTVPAYILAPS